MPNRFRFPPSTVLLIIISVSAVQCYDYLQRIGYSSLAGRMELHGQILSATAESPYQHRILVPWLVSPLITLFATIYSGDRAFLFAYILYDFITIALLFYLLYLWTSIWFSPEQSLIGVLFIASTITVALRDHYFQPWTILEASLFTAGLIASYRNKYWLVAFIVAIATFNRETGIFIPLAFLAAKLPAISQPFPERAINWRLLSLVVGYFCIWLLIFIGVHVMQGPAPSVITTTELIAQNLTTFTLKRATVHNMLFLGFFWLFVVLGWHYAPKFVQRTSFIIPPYLVLILIWGVWYEVRLLMPLYPILLVLGLSYIYPPIMRGQQ